MSHIQKYHISEVLKEVCNRMKPITGAVFPDHRPSAVNEQMSEMIVVSVPGELDEQHAWQKGYLRIEIMVRNKAKGIADMQKLDKMLNAVAETFPVVTKRFSATSPRLLLKGDDGLGFTRWMIRARLVINTTDSYNNEI